MADEALVAGLVAGLGSAAVIAILIGIAVACRKKLYEKDLEDEKRNLEEESQDDTENTAYGNMTRATQTTVGRLGETNQAYVSSTNVQHQGPVMMSSAGQLGLGMAEQAPVIMTPSGPVTAPLVLVPFRTVPASAGGTGAMLVPAHTLPSTIQPPRRSSDPKRYHSEASPDENPLHRSRTMPQRVSAEQRNKLIENFKKQLPKGSVPTLPITEPKEDERVIKYNANWRDSDSSLQGYDPGGYDPDGYDPEPRWRQDTDDRRLAANQGADDTRFPATRADDKSFPATRAYDMSFPATRGADDKSFPATRGADSHTYHAKEDVYAKPQQARRSAYRDSDNSVDLVGWNRNLNQSLDMKTMDQNYAGRLPPSNITAFSKIPRPRF